jgi:predicted DNA-binding transcriptional regulator YafY
MAGPSDPLALNLARVTHRLMVDPRGWRVDRLMDELGIQPRTYRKYRALLQEHLERVLDPSGRWRVVEVRDGQARYLRLSAAGDAAEVREGFLGHVAAFWLARQVFGFAGDGDLNAALDGAWADLLGSVGDRDFTLGHLLRNVDRMLHAVPDAPKDYRGHEEAIAAVLRGLFFSRVLRLSYRSVPAAEPRDHVVHPLTVVVWRSALYLVAPYQLAGRPYLFALDRIESVEATGERFRYPSARDYDPEELFEGSFGIWQERGGTPTRVELHFAARPYLHRYLRERTWHPSQVFEELPDGRLGMTFTVTSMVEVTPWVRSFGGDVEVVEPAGLKG